MNKIAKKSLLVLLLFMASQSQAQLALKVISFKPKGELGMTFKQKTTAELLYLAEFDGKTRLRVGVSFLPLETRLDTFPVYSVVSTGTSTTVEGGYQVIKNAKIGFLNFGMDLRFIEDRKVSPYAGLDITGGLFEMDYEAHYPTTNGENVRGAGGAVIGLRFRLGCQYEITDQFICFADGEASGYVIKMVGKGSNTTLGLGVNYLF